MLRRYTGTTLKTVPMRIIHAILFEVGLLMVLMPFIAWYLGISLWQAFVMDVAFALFYLVYAFVFNWAYDRLFPLPNGRRRRLRPPSEASADHGRIRSVIDQVTKATTASFQKSLRRLKPGRPRGLINWTIIARIRKAEMALVIRIPCGACARERAEALIAATQPHDCHFCPPEENPASSKVAFRQQ